MCGLEAAGTCETSLVYPLWPAALVGLPWQPGTDRSVSEDEVSTHLGEGAVPGHKATVYVGNLSWSTTEDDLAALFEEYCAVVDVRVIQDPTTGRSCGYGFVELRDPEEVPRVVAALNGRGFDGRTLVVSPARPKPGHR